MRSPARSSRSARAFAASRSATPSPPISISNCGHCRWCLRNLEPLCENTGGQVGLECDGAYAEYVKLPAPNFIKLPDGLDYKKHPAEIGVVTDALATPLKVLRRADIKAGETVAVIGAGGGLGIHQVMMAKWARARVIAVDTKPEKFDACRKAGADEVVDASAGRVVEQLLDLTARRGRRRGGRLRLGHRDARSRRQGARPARPPGHARRRQRRQDVPACRRPTCSTRSRTSSAVAMSPAARCWNCSTSWRAARCFRWSPWCARWRRPRPCTNWSSAAR